MIEEKFISILYDSTPDLMGIVEVKGKGRYTFVSANKTTFEANRAKGIKDADYLGADLATYYRDVLKKDKKSADALISDYDWVVKNKKIRSIENVVSHEGSGELVYMETVLSPIIESGECTHVLWVTRDITDRKRTEISLKESEQKFRTLFLNTTDAAFLIEKGFIADCNTNAARLFKMSKKELLKVNPWTLSPETQPNGKNSNEFALQKIEETLLGENQVFEWTHQRKDGTLIETEVSLNLVDKEEGVFFGLVRDISDRIKAEKALKGSQKELELIFNNTSDLIVFYEVTKEGKIVVSSANEAALKEVELKGAKPNDIIGVDFGAYLQKFVKMSKTAMNIVLNDYRNAVKSKKRVTINGAAIPRLDGSFAYLDVTITPILDDSGNCTNLLSVSRDVTESTVAQKALSESQEKLELIYNNTSDLMALCKAETGGDFVYESFNEKFLSAIENTSTLSFRTELIGKTVKESFIKYLKMPREIADQRLANYHKVVETKKSHVFVTSSNRPGVGDLYHETTLVPILDKKNVTHILIAIRDITERVTAEMELKEAFKEVNRLKKQVERENIYLKQELKLQSNHEDIIFSSTEFMEVLDKVEQVAVTDATVLVTGETGTGKELIARAIHSLSERKEKPLIKINCGAIPNELIESELFGHEKGAFTGAIERKLGKFELADGGTIFLDEIGEMPFNLQVKLLRVLQEQEFERVGGVETIKVDVRLITATHRNLKARVDSGKFREDLFYRLNVFPIHIPALRERIKDIPILVEFFVQKFSKKFKKKIDYISEEHMDNLKKYEWPGNVRELENVIERAVIISSDNTLKLDDADKVETKKSNLRKLSETDDVKLDQVMRNHIIHVLERNNWVINGEEGTAMALGLKPSTLRDKMKKLNIKRKI